jgi:hypothetical protein
MNRASLALALLALCAAAPLTACGTKADAALSDAAAASASVSASAVAAPVLTEDSVTLMPVGKWDLKGDDKLDYLWWSIRNAYTHKLQSLTVTIFYYDLHRKQIGKKTFDTPVDIPPKATRELQIGPSKESEPKGTQYRDAVFTKAKFDDGATFDDASQAPDKKEYRGAMPVPKPD